MSFFTRLFGRGIAVGVCSLSLVAVAGSAFAAITVTAPPIDVIFANETAGGGAFMPLLMFKLTGDGSATLTNVKVGIDSTTTPFLNAGEINRLLLFKESGGHPGFQPSEDTQLNTGANLVTDPATGTPVTITVDTASNAVSTTPTDYYVVAKATTSAILVNGHGIIASTTANWITTSAGALGSAFTATKRIAFQQTGNLKVSEVRMGTTGNAGDEFIELYNASEFPIDLQALPLNLYIFSAAGGAGLKSLTYYQTIIPSKGFFLLASETNYSGSTPSNAVYTTLSGNTLLANTGFSIATSSTVTNATSSAIDRIAWGTQPQPNPEGTALADLAADKSYERKATVNSTAAMLAPGGSDSSKGNSQDTFDNSVDFVQQTGSNINPQNANSPTEFPFGGGGQDMEKPRVMGSFPGTSQTGVPLDLSFIGFGLNKGIATNTIISLTATTTVTLTAAGSGTNLCTSVTYNPFPSNFEPSAKCMLSASLSPSTTYTFTATSSMYDLSGNALDQDPFTAGNQAYQITFTTGAAGQNQANITPPFVTGMTPFNGSINIPTNLAKLLVRFNQTTMDATTLTSSNITLVGPSGGIALSSFSFSTTTGALSFVPGSLAANSKYTLMVGIGVKSTNGVALPGPFIGFFTTGAGADSSAPTAIGVVPTGGQTLPLNAVTFSFSTDDNLDQTTATSTAVTLSSSGSNLPGTVEYDPIAKEGRFTATNLLPANVTDLTLTLVGGALRNISGTQIAARTFVWSTEATNSDATGPTIVFANADQFGLAITFNEAVKSTDATTLGNYALTVGGSSVSLSALAGHSISYDPSRRTAEISGLFLPSGTSFTITVSNIKDISGNAMASSGTYTGTTLTPTQSGGMLGPGESSGSFGPSITDFSSSGIGFMPGMKVMPMNAFISASTTYGFELPISKQIPATGKIVITLPTTSDYGLCCAVYTSADNPFITSQNADINGPGAGTVGFSAIVKNSSAKTITLTLDTATRSENSDVHDFLRFAIVDIKNPSIPKGMDSSGYTFDIKTQNAVGTLLESFTSGPIYISGGSVGGSATTTLRGKVTGNGGNLRDVTVRMMSPQTGMLTAASDASGDYTFSNIPVNNQVASFGSVTEYFLSTDPIVTPTGTTSVFFGEPQPTPIRATSTDPITRNFALTATSSAKNFTIALTGDNSSNGIFTASEKLDVFAAGPNRFVVQTYTTAATNYSDTAILTIPIPLVNGSWGIGVGPAMPKGMGSMSFGPPPAPSWVVPRPIEAIVSGCPSSCVLTVGGTQMSSYTFTVSAANRTIAGLLKDDSGNAISNAEIFAFSPANGVGNRGQSSPSGAFSVKVSDGSYNVGAFVPGIGRSRDVTVVVNSTGSYVDGSATVSTGSSGANPFTLRIKKASYTITGRVTDGSNVIANAPVFGYRTDAPGHVDAMTSSDGTYTLYVDTGTWKIGAFIPGFGPATEQTVTITTASKADIDFSPSTATTFYTISGTLFESADATIDSGEGISGAIIRASGSSGSNEGLTSADGTYSIRVPSGSYTFTEIFKPGYGRIAPLDATLTAIGTIDATADATKNIRVKTRRTITVNVKDSNGNALNVSQAFIDLFDVTRGIGNHAEITNATTTTLQIADGASSTIRAFIQGVSPTNISVSSDDAATRVISGILEVNGTEVIKITVNTATAALSSVAGTVYVGSATAGNELQDAWVQFVDPTNNIHFGVQATTSGRFSLKIADGTYQVQASKPGYVSTPSTMTVSGDTISAAIIVTQAGSTISGTVTAGGTAASDAFVWAEKLGGGFSATKTDTSGTYSLSVDSGTWKVYAAAEGYTKGTAGSVSAGAGNVAITLATAASGISSKVVTSNTFSDNSVGSFSDSTVGISVSLDSGALGSAGNTSYLSAKETTNVAETLDTNIIGDKGVDIDATSGTSAVTNLQTGKSAEVTMIFTVAELATDGIDTTGEVGTLKVSSWSDDKKAWESLTTVATYKNSSGVAIDSPNSDLSGISTIEFTTAEASHFSEYALSAPSNADAPATPSGLATSQVTNSFNVTVSWTANSESDFSNYVLYRDTSPNGSFPSITSLSTNSYTDTGRTGGATYYYKLAAVDTSGNESAASSAVSITISQGGGGGGIVSLGGSGSSAAASPTPTPVPAPATATTTTTAQGAVATPGATPGSSVGTVPALQKRVAAFAKNLGIGSRSGDVSMLQELLKADPALYPEGIVSGYFGPATQRAVKRFQAKYG
ncbi:MAG: hypothetical protein A3B29_03150, partial [Candidatus Sungbacteria bacterium RIFCSPLOWO2_01_FULL_51_34]